MTAVRFHRVSHNRKLARVLHEQLGHFKRMTPVGPKCSSTYVSIDATCSDACAFKDRGCYIRGDFIMRKAMRLLDEGAQGRTGADVIAEEVREIDRAWPRGVPQDGARGGRDLRLHVGGDVPDLASVLQLAGAAARWIGRGGGRVWTYTHSWRSVAAEAFWPISVLASVETAEQVREVRRRGYAPALVVPAFPNGKRSFSFAGTSFIPCPAESLEKTCVDCRLCMDVDLAKSGQGIAFQVHGRDATAAQDALPSLVQLGMGRAAA